MCPGSAGVVKPGGQLKRSGGLKRGGSLKRRRRTRPAEGPLTPLQYKLAVFRQQGWKCAVTGEELTMADDAHHPVKKELLRQEGLYHLVWDPRNGMGVKSRIHASHEFGGGVITRDKIPESAWEFARELGEKWVVVIERHHPEPR